MNSSFLDAEKQANKAEAKIQGTVKKIILLEL